LIENLTQITRILTQIQTKVNKRMAKNCQNFGRLACRLWV